MNPKKRILLVDDEPGFTELIQMRLEAMQYDVDVAHTGEDALARASAQTPDLILLDMMMPGMDGLETLRRLRRTQATEAVPVVMLTARGETSAILKAQNARVTDYLIKPCESQDLMDMVRRYA